MGTDAQATSSLLSWSATQTHILTGGGQLEACYSDFHESELPHYYLKLHTCLEMFKAWESNNLVTGAWYRPLFMGGWMESTDSDTQVCNVQTDTLFVDIRIPTLRSTLEQDIKARGVSSVDSLSKDELCALSRQHCFAGFTKVDLSDPEAPVCTRHHCIDWNFHPRFPRSRPNKWRVEMSKDGQSFKEFGVARDRFGQAVYMERWARLTGGKGKTLAAARTTGVMAVLVVVGDIFAIAIDRPSTPECATASGGGCAVLADAAWQDNSRSDLQCLISLEGSFGKIQSWTIERSTHPWREGQCAFADWPKLVHENGRLLELQWGDDQWHIFECGFSLAELGELFPTSKL